MALVYLRHCKINTEKKFKIKLCRCKCGRMVSFSFLRKLWFCWADSPHRAVSKIEWFKERIQHHSKRRQKSGTQYQIYNWWIGHRTWFLGSLRHNIRWANHKFLEQLHHDYIYKAFCACTCWSPNRSLVSRKADHLKFSISSRTLSVLSGLRNCRIR